MTYKLGHEDFREAYPNIEDRKIVWLDSENDVPLVQDAFPELTPDERELLILKRKGLSPEQIDDIMRYWEEVEREQAEFEASLDFKGEY